MKIGFIGLGHMGSAMAANLVKAGHHVTVFNRSPEKRSTLVEPGAHEPAAVETCLPLFNALGQKTLPISPEPAAANLVKLSGNFLLASAIEALGEAIALVSKAGVDRRAYVELLTSTIFPAPVYATYGGLIAAKQFEPAAFTAALGFKDVRLALAAAESLRVPMTLGSLLHDRFLRLLAEGGESLDWSALGGLAGRDRGAARAPG